jgi:photosynthetic reaction center cytochrome c subunit
MKTDHAMNRFFVLAGAVVAGIAGFALVVLTFERPPVHTVQIGHRGVAMELVYNPRAVAETFARQQPPIATEAADPPETDDDRAASIYENVPVLGHLSIAQFGRIMEAMTEWLYPGQGAEGCINCHVPGNFAAEDVYTKHVARRMLQMVHQINTEWRTHVGDTGVTCYTCHRGAAVPANVWSQQPEHSPRGGMAAVQVAQNLPGRDVGLSSLPNEPFTPFLFNDRDIRRLTDTPRPSGNLAGTMNTEWNYALMMHMSTSLGVNCTFCHNSRSFASWESSTPQRVIAWFGIRMLRDINVNYIESLRDRFPPHRLGPMGDTLKANCTTCHLGVYRPLWGAPMARDYPELNLANFRPATPAAQPAAAPAAAPAAPAPVAPAAPAVEPVPEPEPVRIPAD